ncbi:MAG: hypothetical protein ACI4RD_06990 [Kiritimatiellia bacterium]
MNADLERELQEHPELRPVVGRLLAGRERNVERALPVRRPLFASRVLRFAPPLAAASLLAALAFSVWFRPAPSGQPVRRGVYGAREYHLTAEEMIATQNPDGSWQNDFLTQRNAAVLRNVPSAAVAYKRAVRYLRSKGLASRPAVNECSASKLEAAMEHSQSDGYF